MVGQWSTNGATWNTAFNTPFTVSSGCVEIGIFSYSANSSVAVTGLFSGLAYSEPTPTPTTISFVDSVLTASPGDSIQICLQANVVCDCDILSPQVTLIGSSSPHLTGYTSPVLSLSAENNLQCFQLAISSVDTNATYGFTLDSIGTAQVGAIDTLWLEVSAGTEQAEYGLCGSFHLSLTGIDSTKELYQDRFGNLYSRNQLEVPLASSSFNNQNTCGCDEFTDQEVPFQSTNYFELFFEDCIFGNSGFADPALGEMRRRVACKVFAGLANRIEQNVTQCPGQSPPKINIRVPRTGSIAVNGNVLAAASPIYENQFYQMGGIIDGIPWKLINHSGYTRIDNLPNIYHGILYVPFTAPFYLGDAEPPMSGDQFDLETVLLHEALHILGFDSGIDVDESNLLLSGGPRLDNGQSYTRFGTRLVMENNDPVVARSLTDTYEWLLNIGVEDLFSSCSGTNYDDGPRMFYKTLEGSESFPLFTGYPNATPGNRLPSRGSSFSHLDEYCPETPNHYLMSVAIPTDMRLPIGAAEESILCDLGYHLDDGCGCVVAGNHDILDCGGNLLTFELCPNNTTFSLPVSVLLGNDVNANGIIGFEVLNSTDGSMELVGNAIEINPCGPGEYYFRYIPVSSACLQEGNPVVGRVEVRQCSSCDFISTSMDVPRNNPCNLLCNGSVLGLDCLTGQPSGNKNSIGCLGDIDLPGWFGATQTPDYVSQGVGGSPGAILMKAVSMSTESNESIYTPVEITSGDYFFSYYTKGENNPSFTYSMHIGLIDHDLIGQFGNCFNRPLGTSFLDVTPSNYVEIYTGTYGSSSSYVRSSACLTLTDPSEYTAMWFWPEVISVNPGPGSSAVKNLFIDEIELLPDNFSAGEDIVVYCGDAVVLGGAAFCMLSDVAIRYIWKDEVSNILLDYTVKRNLNGQLVITDDQGGPLSEIPSLEFLAVNSATYTLERSVAADSPFSVDLCTTQDELTITVMPRLPTAAFNVGGDAECEFLFTAQEVIPDATYTWDFGDGTTATGLNVSHAFPSFSVYTVELTVNNACGEAVFSQPVSASNLPQAEFTFVEGANCENQEVVFTALLIPEATYFWNFGDGATAAGQVVEHTFPAPLAYTVELTVSNDCGESVFTQQVLAPDCLTCEDCNVNQTIGQPGVTTKLSDAIASNLLPANSASGLTRCIEGTLLLDFISNTQTSYGFYNCVLQMGPGARILIAPDFSVDINESIFLGCDAMWRGIEVSAGATVKGILNSQISDAQYGLYLNPGTAADPTYVYANGNVFRDNFVGVYVAGGSGNILNWINTHNKYTSTAALLPPFSGQTAAPEGLPQLAGSQALAGIVADAFPGVRSRNNTYQNLTSGIILRKASAWSFDDDFFNIRDNGNHYTAFDLAGVAVYSRGSGAQTLTVEMPLVDNCKYGINANMTSISATSGQYMNVDHGIGAILVGSGETTIGGSPTNQNTIDALFTGILIAVPVFNSTVNISNNDVTISTPGNLWGVGIGILSNEIGQATVSQNQVTVNNFGKGIWLGGSKRVEVIDNSIMLMGDNAQAGIQLYGAMTTSCRVVDNVVTGPGPDGNTTVGLDLVNAAGNAYCCNTFQELNVGMQVNGASTSTDLVRGNTFGVSQTSLLLPNVNAILGSQTHTQNCWTTSAGPAIYGLDELNPVALEFAQGYSFTVDPTISACFMPAAHFPMGWFEDPEDTEYEGDICTLSDCEPDMLAPESDDVKRIAVGDTVVSPAVMWDLQRYVYRKLQGETVQNVSILSFLARADTSSIQAFYTLDYQIKELLTQDSITTAQLRIKLGLVEEKLDSLLLLDTLFPIADSLQLIGLEGEQNDLLNALYGLAEESQNLADQWLAFIADEAGKLRSQNDSIGVIHLYEVNEKEVNDSYLSWLSNGFASADSTESAALQ